MPDGVANQGSGGGYNYSPVVNTPAKGGGYSTPTGASAYAPPVNYTPANYSPAPGNSGYAPYSMTSGGTGYAPVPPIPIPPAPKPVVFQQANPSLPNFQNVNGQSTFVPAPQLPNYSQASGGSGYAPAPSQSFVPAQPSRQYSTTLPSVEQMERLRIIQAQGEGRVIQRPIFFEDTTQNKTVRTGTEYTIIPKTDTPWNKNLDYRPMSTMSEKVGAPIGSKQIVFGGFVENLISGKTAQRGFERYNYEVVEGKYLSAGLGLVGGAAASVISTPFVVGQEVVSRLDSTKSSGGSLLGYAAIPAAIVIGQATGLFSQVTSGPRGFVQAGASVLLPVGIMKAGGALGVKATNVINERFTTTKLTGQAYVTPTSDVIQVSEGRSLRLSGGSVGEVKASSILGSKTYTYTTELPKIQTTSLVKPMDVIGQPKPVTYTYQGIGKVTVTSRVGGRLTETVTPVTTSGGIVRESSPATQVGLRTEFVKVTKAAGLRALVSGELVISPEGYVPSAGIKLPEMPGILQRTALRGLNPETALKVPSAKGFYERGGQQLGTIQRVSKAIGVPESTLAQFNIAGKNLAVKLTAFGKQTAPVRVLEPPIDLVKTQAPRAPMRPFEYSTKPTATNAPVEVITPTARGGATVELTKPVTTNAPLKTSTESLTKTAGVAVSESITKAASIAKQQYVNEFSLTGVQARVIPIVAPQQYRTATQSQSRQAQLYRVATSTPAASLSETLTRVNTKVVEPLTKTIPDVMSSTSTLTRTTTDTTRVPTNERVPPIFPNIGSPGLGLLLPAGGGNSPGGTSGSGSDRGGSSSSLKGKKQKLFFTPTFPFPDILAFNRKGFGTPLSQKEAAKYFRASPFPELIPPKEFAGKAPAQRGNISTFKYTGVSKNVKLLLFGKKKKKGEA